MSEKDENEHVEQHDAEAVIAADFAETFLMHLHRGVIYCGDRFVIFGNDGYKNSNRSRHEAELVMKALADHEPMFGVSHEGCTWSIVLTDYTRELFDECDLEELVWDAWQQVMEEAEEQQEGDEFLKSIVQGGEANAL